MFASKYWEHGIKAAILLSLFASVQSYYSSSSEAMGCKYGERGSLTAICYNATPNVFTDTSYRFDHLDETLVCLNCTLTELKTGTFDISGNRIQVLNLTNCAIENIEEKAFTGLVFLEKLILSDNYITHIQVGAFHGARKIKTIYLDYALGGPLPDYVFQELTLLKELYVRNNLISTLESKTFYGLENLEILDLSHNHLRELNNSLVPLKNLKVVVLEHNQIYKIGPTDFQGLQNLLEINLADNRLESVNFNLTLPNSLRKLNLSDTHIGNNVIRLNMFESMHNLEVLDLSLNWFAIIPTTLFRGLYNLRVLDLSRNTIRYFETGPFTGLPSLRMLNLSHNVIITVEVTGKLSLHQLHIIDLSANKIGEIEYARLLQRAPKLTKIQLSNNSMSCKLRRQLEEYLKRKNVQFTMDLKNCPNLDEAGMEEVLKLIENKTVDYNGDSNPATTTLKILFLLLIIALVGLLYYIHFFILIPRKY